MNNKRKKISKVIKGKERLMNYFRIKEKKRRELLYRYAYVIPICLYNAYIVGRVKEEKYEKKKKCSSKYLGNLSKSL
jgi:hypothetical protein